MLTKKRKLLYNGLIGCLIWGVIMCMGVSAGAQQESLEKQLAEAKAAIADQITIIEKLKDNFFEVTGTLEKEIDRLKKVSAEKEKTIKKMTDNYFKVTGELKDKIEELQAQNAEQKELIQKITDNFFK
ncbi:hypothetical protein DRJ00_04250, partial [Candidatus Aerophobetes bacterium]